MNGKQAVYLDFDGTLFDSIPIAYRATCEIFAEAQCAPPSFEDYVEHCHAPFEVFFNSRGVGLSKDELWIRFNREVNNFEKAQFFTDVVPVLATLARHQWFTGIISAQQEKTLLHHCDKSGITRSFSAGIQGDIADKAAAITLLREKHELPIQNVWYIGDFPSDMKHARAAGVRAVGILRGNHRAEKMLRTAGAHYCVNTLYEFLALAGICGGD